jgi:hypothetical protein
MNPEYQRLTSSNPAASMNGLTNASGLASQPVSPSTNMTSTGEAPTHSDIQTRSVRIMEALKAGEEIYQLHHQILYDSRTGAVAESASQSRMQNAFLGELILKVVQYVRLVRKSQTISDKIEKSQLERVLQ